MSVVVPAMFWRCFKKELSTSPYLCHAHALLKTGEVKSHGLVRKRSD